MMTALDSDRYNDNTIRALHLHEVHNSTVNHHILVEAMLSGRAHDIGMVPKDDTPALVIGSGPSLDDNISRLKEWKGRIVCSTSQARTLVRHGAPPTHIVGIDPFSAGEEIAGVDWKALGTTLVVTPTVWPSLVSMWEGPILLYRPTMGRRSFYSTTLSQMYALREGSRSPTWTFLIPTELPVFACSPPMQMLAAAVLGSQNVFLCGCDFGYTGGRGRFTESIPDGNGGWKELVTPMPKDEPDARADDNGVLATDMMRFYKKNTLTAWRLALQDVWTLDDGTVTEVPRADIDHMMARQGRHMKTLSNEEKRLRAERFMARHNGYCVDTDTGPLFVDSHSPEDVEAYIRVNVNREFMCPLCGCMMTAPDDRDRTGTKCPNCKTVDSVVRRTYADIPANMKRIRARYEEAHPLTQQAN